MHILASGAFAGEKKGKFATESSRAKAAEVLTELLASVFDNQTITIQIAPKTFDVSFDARIGLSGAGRRQLKIVSGTISAGEMWELLNSCNVKGSRCLKLWKDMLAVFDGDVPIIKLLEASLKTPKHFPVYCQLLWAFGKHMDAFVSKRLDRHLGRTDSQALDTPAEGSAHLSGTPLSLLSTYRRNVELTKFVHMQKSACKSEDPRSICFT